MSGHAARLAELRGQLVQIGQIIGIDRNVVGDALGGGGSLGEQRRPR